MTIKMRTIELVPRPLEAVRFEGNQNEREEIRQWLQDRTVGGTVVLSDEAVYIEGPSGTEKVEVGEWVLFDIVDRWLTSATDGAIRAFYRDIEFTPDS